jgi:hypothetical protein
VATDTDPSIDERCYALPPSLRDALIRLDETQQGWRESAGELLLALGATPPEEWLPQRPKLRLLEGGDDG